MVKIGLNAYGQKGVQTPMFSGLDAIKKAKKTGQKREKGRGAMQKKSVFVGDRLRKLGVITPTVRTSSIPTVLISHNKTFPIFAVS